MFGYVRPYKPELKIRDFETYKAVYCGLCHTLGKRYSFFVRIILSYDATFIAIFQLALSPQCAGFEKHRCPARPYGKRSCCRMTEEVEYSADLAVILFFYKLRDNLKDASGILKKCSAFLLYPFAAVMHRKAQKKNPVLDESVRNYIGRQAEAEQKRAGIDEASDPTAKLMSDIFLTSVKNEADRRPAERMGYFFGRWVYLMDAADDLADDIKNGDYNPFAAAYDLKPETELNEVKKQIGRQLNACQYEIAAAYELLSLRRFQPVLANIVYLGLPDMADSVLKGRKVRPL